MTTILIRTVIIYIFLLTIMRIMGKRQLGELEVSELVSTLLLSDIASLPITDQSIPLVYAIIPIVTITTFEVVMSVLLTKVPFFKNLLSARPAVLIQKGVVDRKEMMKNRISIDELLSELRQKDISDITEVDYAIIEQNGKMTVFPKRLHAQPTSKELGLAPMERGICHVLISDGRINRHGLSCTGKSEEWVIGVLKKQKTSLKEVFLMTLDDSDRVNVIQRNGIMK
ncbi:MAG: DUF421 domain-containing protein [Clostridia bacterium]|nr:DUF421 domain-containing protein [Clostridia bacterium]